MPSDTALRISPDLSARKRQLADFLDRVWGKADMSAVDTHVADSYTIHNDPGDPWHGQTLDRAGFKNRLLRSRGGARPAI